MTEIDAMAAPDLVNEVIADVTKEAPPEKAKLPDIEAPLDTSVVLPCGWYNMVDGSLVKDAEVRELTGEDEEILARVAGKSPRKFFTTILERGVVRIGESRDVKARLNGLTVGDIDALLLAIRYVTYGENLELDVTCPACSTNFTLDLYLPKEIPVKTLAAASDLDFEVTLRRGRKAQVTLATYEVQNLILDGKDRTAAEINSLLLSEIVQSIDGDAVSLTSIRALGMKDRQTLINAVTDHTAGPQLEKVRQPCPECSEEIPLPLSMADLFQLS